MRKISTLYKKNPENLGRVIDEINPENEWVLKGEGMSTRKFDGTAAAIINGELYKRYDVKKGRQVPINAIPCQQPDEITGHWPHWVKCNADNKGDKHFIEGLENADHWSISKPTLEDGTYELVGPKVRSNPEMYGKHTLVKHGAEILDVSDFTFEGLQKYLSENDIEGIVFHHVSDGRMCKIRKSDFGIKR